MQRSTDRILTTHCGSLPRSQQLMELLAARDLDQPYNKHELAQRISSSVEEVVRRQLACGLNVVNDGE